MPVKDAEDPNGFPREIFNQMFVAARAGDVAQLEILCGEWRRCEPPKHLTPNKLRYVLQEAVWANQPAAVACLLDQQSDWNTDTVSMAFYRHDQRILLYQVFLDHGWDINDVPGHGREGTLLMYVLPICPVGAVNGVNCNSKVTRHAVTQPKLLKWCLDHGADPNIRLRRGWTALEEAAARSTPEVLRELVECGGDLGAVSPIHAAAAAGPKAEVKQFGLIKDDDVEYIDDADDDEDSGSDVQDTSIRIPMLAVLLDEYQMDINAKSKWNLGHHRMGDNVNGTPLHAAITNDNLRTAMFLLQRGAKLECEDEFGVSALGWARKRGSREMIELLEQWTKHK